MASLTMSQLASRLASASRALPENTSRKVAQFAQVGTGIMKSEIQRMHAVDTSTMLNSTRAEPSGRDTWEIGTTPEYSVFVALGTSRMKARPFHLTSAELMRKEVKNFGFNVGDLGL